MRVLMVLIALVAAPFLASVAQGSQSARNVRSDIRYVRHSDEQPSAMRGAKHGDDDEECQDSDSKTWRGRAAKAHKHASRGHHYGWRHGQHDDDDSCDTPPAPAPAPLGGIQGGVFFDMSYDGVWDSGEPGIPNWLIMLSGPVNATALTDAAGNYSFTGLPDGTYTVCEAQRFGWIQTAPTGASSCTSSLGYDIVITAGQVVTQRDFGNVG